MPPKASGMLLVCSRKARVRQREPRPRASAREVWTVVPVHVSSVGGGQRTGARGL
jgi:hypothetical protein